MTRILLADDSALVNGHLATMIRERLDCEVDVFARADACLAAPVPAGGWDVAIVDLSFPTEAYNGADVLVRLHLESPGTKLVVYTQGDPWAGDLLRDTWEAIPLATALGKSMQTSDFLRAIELVVRDGSAPIDPVLQPLLPERRSPWRCLENYSRLVPHKGHAKLWRALIAASGDPSYRELAVSAELSVNTVRNYRVDLVGELHLHGLDDPTMRVMQQFAKRCRPFLTPAMLERLAA